MEELNEAYKSIEMLIALNLPISKDQLATIDRFEKQIGIEKREDIRAYYYAHCFTHYTSLIMSIRQAKIHGEVIVAKPVLLLSLIDGIASNQVVDNKFQLAEWLELRYIELMNKYMRNSQFDKPTDISNPFWHLQTDGFWHLQYPERPMDGATPSKRWLKEKVSYAYFDDDLWILLQNEVWRTKLREYIIEHKLTDDSWKGKLAAEGFGIIAAIILAA